MAFPKVLQDTMDDFQAVAREVAMLYHPSWREYSDERVIWAHNDNNLTVGTVRKARKLLGLPL